jgi:hypothetical protein
MKPKSSLPCSQQPMTSPVLSQMNSVNTLPSCFSILCLKIVLPSTPRSYKWSLSFRCSYQNHCNFSSLPCAPCVPSISSRFPMLHLYICLPLALARSSKWSLSSGVPTKTILFHLSPIHTTCSTYLIPLNVITTQHDLVTGHSRNHI